jgi:hypothetical protein
MRRTVGAVFLGFGALTCFPGVSPAQGLSIQCSKATSTFRELQARVTRQPPARGRTTQTTAIRRTRVQ